MERKRVRQPGVAEIQKLSEDISKVALKPGFPPKGIEDTVLEELLNCAFLASRNNLAAKDDIIWDLKELCKLCGNNSYVSKSGLYIEGRRPKYAEAAELANIIAEELGFTSSWTEEDFPSISAWEKAEVAFSIENGEA